MAGSKGAPKRGWYRDPTGRHELRRWDGDGWSEWVMDGARRHFDDIDGCGGPPVGDLVSGDGGSGAGGGAGLAKLRPRRPLRAVGDRPARARRPPSVGDGRIAPDSVGAGLDRNRRLTSALVVTFAASAVAFAVVTLVDGSSDALESVVPSALHRLAAPFALAAVAVHVIAVAGLLLARSGRGGPNPLRPPTRLGGEDLLRGGIAFLLALFAVSFVASAARGGGVQWSDIPVRLDALAALEIVLLLLAGPVVQERLFRGLLLVVLRDRFGPVVGVLGQAAVAGAALSWMAAPGGRTAAALAAFAIAAVFGWFAHATDDLRPGMLGSAFFGLWLLVGRFGA